MAGEGEKSQTDEQGSSSAEVAALEDEVLDEQASSSAEVAALEEKVLASLPASVQSFISSLQSELGRKDKDNENLRKRNVELACILGHSQSEKTAHELKMKELHHSLSLVQHELASLRAAVPAATATPPDESGGDEENNPFLSPSSANYQRSGSIVYVAASAADVLAGKFSDDFDAGLGETGGMEPSTPPSPPSSSSLSLPPEPPEVSDTQADGAEKVPQEVEAAAAEEEEEEEEEEGTTDANEDEEEGDEEDASVAKVKEQLQFLFKSLLSLTGTSERVLGKAEFDLLQTVCGLEDSKKFRADLVSASLEAKQGSLVDRQRGLSWSEFLAAFTSANLPVPGSSSVPSAVWKTINAEKMGPLLRDDKRRLLLETELGRWNKALDVYGESSSDGEYDDDDDDDDDDDVPSDPESGERNNGEATDDEYEPWDLGSEWVSGGVEEMRERFEVLGAKRHGEKDLGWGRAGVVRKCREKQRRDESNPDEARNKPGRAEQEVGLEEEQRHETTAGEGAGGAAAAGSFAGAAPRGKGRVLACKIISKKQQSATDTTRELEIMRRLQSAEANVVQLVDVFEAPEKLFVMSELCEGGELYDLVLDRARRKPEVKRDLTTTLLLCVALVCA